MVRLNQSVAWTARGLVVSVAAGLAWSCGGEAVSDTASDGSEIIAGVPANGARLNAIGSIGVVYADPYDGSTHYSFYCSATLIGDRAVLTAKHCSDFFAYDYSSGYKTVFAVGPDASNPKRTYEVVEAIPSPDGVGTGLVGYGHDVAVLHLGEAVTGILPLPLCDLKRSDVGKKLVAIGYGVQNNTYQAGTRRVGNVTVRALDGQLYQIVFGSFEAFKRWASTGEAPAGNDLATRLPGLVIPSLRALPGAARAAVDGAGGGAGGASGGVGVEAGTGPGGSAAGGTGGGDPYEEYLRFIYENTSLEEGYEALVGGAPGDAQPCFGDSGGPLLESKGGQLSVRGVASGVLRTNRLVCDLGAVYATFGPQAKEFIESQKDWVDPCDGVTRQGACVQDLARRCTDPSEGARRLVEFDCSLLGQVCDVQADGMVGCSDPQE